MFIKKTMEVPVELIKANSEQPRKNFAEEQLIELRDSIKEFGVLQPLILKREVNGDYLLIAGERRLRAAMMAGLDRVPAVIKDASDEEVSLIALVENIQRENLGYIEEAKAYRNIMEKYGMSQLALSEKLGKNQSTISNKIRLLSLPKDIQDILVENKLTERHARALLKIEDDQMRRVVIGKVLKHGFNVKQTEKLVDDIKNSTAASIGSSNGSFNSEPVGTCPHCSGKIKESKSGFYCENYPEDKGSCKFTMFKDNRIFKLTREDAEKLCKGEHIKKNVKYNGKEWLQELYYDVEQHKVSFFKPEVVQISAKCPICGKELTNTSYSLICECGFKLNRKIAEYKLSEKDINELLTKGKTRQITKFYSTKKKKYFSAYLVVKDKEIKLVF